MTMIEISLFLVGLSLVAFVIVQAVHTDLAFGLHYGASARDEEKSNALSKRLARVVRNQVEGVAILLPLVILADGHTLTGTEANAISEACLGYAISRPVHGLLQAVGTGWPRSIVWLIGLCALLVGYSQVALA